MVKPRRQADPPLTLHEIAQGVHAALENARALVDDASILLQNRSYARSLSCILVAEQEAGKTSVLRSMARIDPSRADHWKVQWSNFRSHEEKGARGIFNALPEQYRSNPKALLLKAMELRIDDADDAEQARRLCLYVDFDPESRIWLCPSNVPGDVVYERLELADQVVARLERLRDAGLFSIEALSVEHEVYTPYTRSHPAKRVATPEELETLISDQQGLLRRYVQRLVEKGLLRVEMDVTFMGRPLQEWLGDDSANDAE